MFRSDHLKILFQTISIGGFILSAHSFSFASGDFTHDVHYTDAVPHFIEALKEATGQVKDDQELQEIFHWEQSIRPRAPEFLRDLLVIARSLEINGGSEQYVFDQYKTFSDKWNEIAHTYPGLTELEPVLQPVIQKLFEGLPSLQSPSSSNPMSGLYDWYKAMEATNPWGIGNFFKIPDLPSEHKIKTIHEISDESTISGVKNIHIIHREAVVTRNGLKVFYELTQDGQLINRSVEYRDPSVLHETLKQMKLNGENPLIIQALQDMINLIDDHLESAFQNGVLDECSYAYIYRRDFSGQLSYCQDRLTNLNNYQEMLTYDPEDHVNQVLLSNPNKFWINNLSTQFETSSSVLEKETLDQKSSSILNQYTSLLPNIPSIPPEAAPIIFIPGVLLSTIGFFKLF